jgi:hypothetical protein
MHWRDFRILVYFVVAAVIFGIVGWVTLAPAITWIVPIVTLWLILLGLGINSLVLVTHTYPATKVTIGSKNTFLFVYPPIKSVR